MQKDLYAPYPSNLNRLLSVTHARRASVAGRREASGATGQRQARAEGEWAGRHVRGGRAGASAEGRWARGERGWPAPGERGGHLQPW